MNSHTPITAQELQKMKQRCDEATEGPWVAMEIPPASYSDHGFRAIVKTGDWMIAAEKTKFLRVGPPTVKGGARTVNRSVEDQEAELDFIVNARQDLPRCIAEIERLRAALQDIADCEEHAECCIWHLHGNSEDCRCNVSIARKALGITPPPVP